MIKKRRFKNNYNAGFSLIEVAIALTVMGIMVGLAIPALTHMRHLSQIKTTDHHQQAVLTAISLYALRNGHLPLPAIDDHGHAQSDHNSGTITYHGFVPYVTLGIPAGYARDGFQQPLIYVVPELAGKVNTDELSWRQQDDPGQQIHQPHVSPARKFCFEHVIDDHKFNIMDDMNLPLFISDDHHNADVYHDFVVLVLYSRGEEAQEGNPSHAESTNNDHSFNFYDQPYSTNPNARYRHRLKWMTRDFLINHYGHASCPALRYHHAIKSENNYNLNNNLLE